MQKKNVQNFVEKNYRFEKKLTILKKDYALVNCTTKSNKLIAEIKSWLCSVRDKFTEITEF